MSASTTVIPCTDHGYVCDKDDGLSSFGSSVASTSRVPSKFFDNYVTRKFMSADDIINDKLKAGAITVLTGLVILGVLAGLAWLGVVLAPILLGGAVPIGAAAVGGVVVGVFALVIVFKGLSTAVAAIRSRINPETQESDLMWNSTDCSDVLMAGDSDSDLDLDLDSDILP